MACFTFRMIPGNISYVCTLESSRRVGGDFWGLDSKFLTSALFNTTWWQFSKNILDWLLTLFSGELDQSHFSISPESNSLQQNVYSPVCMSNSQTNAFPSERWGQSLHWGERAGMEHVSFVLFCLYRINSVTSPIPALSRPCLSWHKRFEYFRAGLHIDCP